MLLMSSLIILGTLFNGNGSHFVSLLFSIGII